MLVRMQSRNSPTSLVGMQNGAATLENSLALSYKTPAIQSSSGAPWYLPRGAEKLCPHKNLNMDVYSSFIDNCQNLETNKIQ